MQGLVEHFAELADPRVERAKRHSLLAVVTMALCGVICGAESGVEIEQFGHAKAEWFATFLDVPNGIPSHDPFGRVFAHLDAQQLEACFTDWMRAVAGVLPAQVIALDGKTVRRSHDRAAGKAALQLVSAWASANRLVLAQVAVDDKSNEITALPLLLRQLALSGCIVTSDAMGCQREIAEQIGAQAAEYVLAREGQGADPLRGSAGHLRLGAGGRLCRVCCRRLGLRASRQQGAWAPGGARALGALRPSGAGLSRRGGALAGTVRHRLGRGRAPLERREGRARGALLPAQHSATRPPVR